MQTGVSRISIQTCVDSMLICTSLWTVNQHHIDNLYIGIKLLEDRHISIYVCLETSADTITWLDSTRADNLKTSW